MPDSTVAVPAQLRRVPADAATLLAAADTDADALADRLHDGALQALVVARYAADAAVRGGDPALARDAVQDALVALRRFVWDLRPRGADDLCTALHELSQRRVEAGAEALVLELDPAVASALSAAAAGAAYRFVQAALPDGPATVVLAREGDRAVLTGDGAPEDLTGWAARATALGGALDTRGPAARLLLPLDRTDDAHTDSAKTEDAR